VKRAPGRSPGDPRAVTDLVKQLGTLLAELGLAEVEVSWGDIRIRLQRPGPAPAAAPVTHPAAPVPHAAAPTVAAPVVDVPRPGLVTIEAPMVGTFYRASSPTADPYVREGDVVKEGQILCIIEAMKLMNEIESKVAGRVAQILVDNGQPVEYGQPLFLLEPLG
jgi:acetyl-CoA carboxylase biotin carboxyl carrier protein